MAGRKFSPIHIVKHTVYGEEVFNIIILYFCPIIIFAKLTTLLSQVFLLATNTCVLQMEYSSLIKHFFCNTAGKHTGRYRTFSLELWAMAGDLSSLGGMCSSHFPNSNFWYGWEKLSQPSSFEVKKKKV